MRLRIRKTIACLLAACIAAVCVPFSAAAADAPMKLMVAADTHFQCAADLGEPNDLYTEYMLEPETFAYASTQGQMNYESEAILAEMLDQFASSDAEYLLIAGDLTCGKRASHLAFAEYLRRAEEKSGKQIFVIVGNHDCAAESTDDRISMEEFREIYAQFGYDEALARHGDSASYAVDLDENYRLLAVDSCIYGEDDGKIGTSVFRWIREQTDRAKQDGKTPLVMMHHSILPHYELQPMIDSWRFFAGWFADHGIRTVLTGHIHANDISSAVSDCGNTLYDIQTGALISSPNTYRILTMEQDAVAVESRYITKIDTSLLPAYLTDAQKAKLAEDFPGYAKEYFVEGVCKWLNRNVGSANRLVRWFKLKEGTKAYEAAEHLTARLGAAVGQNIYGTDGASIEAALAPYGIEVPRSEYTKPYEVAAKLMYGFFRGDEDAEGNEADTQLLLTCLEGAVLTAIQSGTDESSLRALARAMEIKTDVAGAVSATKPAVWMRQLAEKTAQALIETLAGGFIDDYSAPEDLNVTLTYDETREDGAPLHLIEQLLRLFIELWTRVFRVLSAAR
ncbi:MAG: metallophosphoesterase [Clostridia bacterium]|nr:metallophosphoesterase [Clostridia bacterium]